MTNPRIGHFSPPANIIGEISDDAWATVESIYSIELSAEDKTQLTAIRSRYALWRQAEEYGAREEQANKVLKRLTEAADAMRYLARFTGSGDDASSAVNLYLKRAMSENAVAINPKHLLAIGDEVPQLVRAIADDFVEPLYVTLSRELIGELSRSIDISLASVRKSIAESVTVKGGDALSLFDRYLCEWAEERGLKIGISNNRSGEASRFLKFMFELDQTLPSELRSFHSTEANIRKTVTAARRRWNLDPKA